MTPRGRTLSHDEQANALAILQQVFDHMIVHTRVVSSRSRVRTNSSSGWLAYSNFDRAYKAVGDAARGPQSARTWA